MRESSGVNYRPYYCGTAGWAMHGNIADCPDLTRIKAVVEIPPGRTKIATSVPIGFQVVVAFWSCDMPMVDSFELNSFDMYAIFDSGWQSPEMVGYRLPNNARAAVVGYRKTNNGIFAESDVEVIMNALKQMELK